MGKFGKGFIFGSLVGGIGVLLTTKRSGTENRQILKAYKHNITSNANNLKTGITQLNTLKSVLLNEAVPEINNTLKDVQTTIRHFMEDNQPHIKRIQSRLELLKEHLETNKQTEQN